MLYGLIGKPLGHSYSPEIHSIFAPYRYELGELENFELEGFFRERSFKAINVTIPYKQSVIPYLDCISDNARRIGAVNTVVNREGRLFGYNTDYAGMMALARRMNMDVRGKKVLILGTGGTAKTAGAVLEDMGAGEIITVSRREKPGCVSYERVKPLHCDASAIINATPVGMYPNADGSPLSLDGFEGLESVLDAVYNPLRTDLVLDARERGISAEGGLYMLASQAVYACGKFLDREMDEADIERAYSAVKADKQNIVLIGMPSSGKTGAGKKLAALCGRTFADTDEEIIKRIGMPIADFFALRGEAEFRKKESEVIAELSRKSSTVIATGGGAVLNGENIRRLKHNGLLIFLDRAPERLIATPDRPLSSNMTAVRELYSKRYNIYRTCADITVDGNGTVDETAESIYKELFG